MRLRALKSFAATLLVAACAAALPTGLSRGIARGLSRGIARAARQTPAPRAAAETPTPRQSAEQEDEQVGRVSARFERGGRVSVDNRSTGRIRVVGWDREAVEAVASSERGGEAVRVKIEETPAGRRVSFYADYADQGRYTLSDDMTLEEMGKLPNALIKNPRLDGRANIAPQYPPAVPAKALPPKKTPPAGSTPPPAMKHPASAEAGEPAKSAPARKFSPPGEAQPEKPMMFIKRPKEIEIEVRVPRYAEVEVIKVIRSPVEVSNIDTPIRVLGDRSEVKLSGVGAAEVRTTSGRVLVEGARGAVDVTTFDGEVEVRDSRGDVRARSITGRISIACARGRVDVTSADGPVSINGGGDVNANTTSSDVRLAGVPREEGRYNLKSMTGRVEVFVEGSPAGFTAALSSYRGTISSDFPLQVSEDTTDAATNRRRVGRFGDGRAQLSLDSFEGAVKLSRAAPGAGKVCGQ